MRLPHTTRREFALAIGATALAACARRVPGGPAPEPAIAPVAPPGPGRESEHRAEASDATADALLAVVAARYGTVLPADHRDDVRKGIARTLTVAEPLRRATVTNAADPFTVCGVGMGRRA